MQKPEAKRNIDLTLAVLCSIKRNRSMSSREIADICGCSHAYIEKIEARALAKLKHPNIKAKLQSIMENINE
jgi:DNA-directed RNA polymerase sigma subunit (sigma70/sigma32)